MGFADSAPGTTLPIFYNVVHAVGKQCPNYPDDVKLVQYLLKAFYEGDVSWRKPPGEMLVTGECGTTTMNWIIHFQRDVARAHPGKIALDNRVDRIRNKNFKGSITNTVYALGCLNQGVAAHNAKAFAVLPMVVPLANRTNVPPPSTDIVNPKVVPSSTSGGV
ncbi:MAG: hypothetical protein AB7F88_18965 [Pyrinomonadaceae bacterium]